MTARPAAAPGQPRPLPASLRAAAEQLRHALSSGITPVIVDSPPGAGKTTLVSWAATQPEAGGRVAVVTCTNNQSGEVAARIAERAPRLRVVVYLGADADLPNALRSPTGAAASVVVVRSAKALPPGPCIVVGNLFKWAGHPAGSDGYDLAVFDEAYQMAWHQVWPLSGLASRHVLVGDPGQIVPFSNVHSVRWLGDPSGPLQPAAAVVAATHPEAPVIRLPVSLRLPDDTARIVQPALYPDLPFTGAAPPGTRRLIPGPQSAAPEIALLAQGSLSAFALPGTSADLDPDLCARAANVAAELLGTGARTADGADTRPLTAERMAVVCARTRQAAAVRAALPAAARAVTVDTANRLQGLEWDVVVAVCPLAGHSAVNPFELEPGRLSVMLTRHRTACLLLTRERVDDVLAEHVPVSDRAPGEHDAELAGLRAHRRLRGALLSPPTAVDAGSD